MKISYFLYSLLVAAWIFTDAPIYNRSRWWAFGTFILPFLFLYYVVKTRPANKYWKYIGLWVLGFTFFFTVEDVVFPQKELLKSIFVSSSTSSGLKGQVQKLSNKSELSATNFQKALNSLNEIRDLDTIPKINEAIRTVERAQLLFYQGNQDSDNFFNFINENKTQLEKDFLHMFGVIEGLRNETYFSSQKALEDYLNAYKTMLEYSRNNFEAIIQGKKPQRDIFNQLYLKYRNAFNVQNEASLRHGKFIDQYSSEHPDFAEFISKTRQEMKEK